MYKTVLQIVCAGLLITIFSCKHKTSSNSYTETDKKTVISRGLYDKESDNTQKIPQIIKIDREPERLSKEVTTYTVTLTTEGSKVKLEDTQFSIDEKKWQDSPQFNNVKCGKQVFYARNKRNKSWIDKKEYFLECFVDVPVPTISHLNELLTQIADCDDDASDQLRELGKNLPVRGINDISNIEQLLRDACVNRMIYVVKKIETDKNGNLSAIIIQ